MQYVEYLWNVVRGDFGTTISDNRPVTEILTTYGAATFRNLSCIRSLWRSLSAFHSVWLPLVFAIAGRTHCFVCLPSLATPPPCSSWASSSKLIFSVNLGIFPIAGRASSQGGLEMSRITSPTGIYLLDALRLGDMQLVGDVLLHAVLPAIALGMLTGGVFLRLVRTNLIGTLEQPYIESARSRGVGRPGLSVSTACAPRSFPSSQSWACESL